MNLITDLCHQLRNNQTPAEKRLWQELRRRNIKGEKFLRQFPIFITNGTGQQSFYIADFYNAKLKLVVEVDGPIHLLKKEYDANRDLVMRYWGFNILRFTNDEVINELGKVLLVIDNYITISH
ncbi:endonuclease domain-containing protein [Mucilaginibacter sp. X5P1]|uniref:endonuclease domain-containing protein n=1 Tax=Mucilaginibacter sp. X5P1 TaxID=2723088 RepID=UPI00160B40FF|nr:endonuclease domain-containing protein [Mucilaginibacter sp. X5P1]MBB6139713.1 very-short-patch-repair endonuclease [Mucilaginibacter sp. X5P1]